MLCFRRQRGTLPHRRLENVTEWSRYLVILGSDCLVRQSLESLPVEKRPGDTS